MTILYFDKVKVKPKNYLTPVLGFLISAGIFLCIGVYYLKTSSQIYIVEISIVIKPETLHTATVTLPETTEAITVTVPIVPTGTQEIPETTAKGQVRLISTGGGATIETGTIIAGRYKLINTVRVPGVNYASGTLGIAFGQVEALQAGVNGNQSGGVFYLNGIRAEVGELRGGANKMQPVVKPEDIELAKQTAVLQTKELASKAPEGFTLMRFKLSDPVYTQTGTTLHSKTNVNRAIYNPSEIVKPFGKEATFKTFDGKTLTYGLPVNQRAIVNKIDGLRLSRTDLQTNVKELESLPGVEKVLVPEIPANFTNRLEVSVK